MKHPSTATATTTANKFERFEQWLRNNGAKFDQLELRSYESTSTPSKTTSDMTEIDNETATIIAANEEKKEPNTMYTTDEDDIDVQNRKQQLQLQQQQQSNDEEEESEMRGVHAKSTIPPNTICMSIPLQCLITVEMGQATEIGQLIYKSNLDLDAPKHIYLMIYILWDRKMNGSQSFFAPYYNILPKSLRNMPIFWNESELYELTGSYIVQQIQDRNRAIYDDYTAICSVVPYFTQIATIEEFQWARMCVCSRNFGLCIHGQRTSALVPHADMLNHYRPRETKWTYDETIQSFTITTLQQSIPAGGEVYDSYGQKCNHRFLLNYGFAIEQNIEVDGFCPNEVPIECILSTQDPIFHDKLDFWVRGSTNPSSNHTSNSSNTISSNIVQYAVRPEETLPSTTKTSTTVTNSNSNNNNTLEMASREHMVQTTMKRIRICVTNNDNTRFLFSLLRIIVATPNEFYHDILLVPKYTTTPITTPAASTSLFHNKSNNTKQYNRPTIASTTTINNDFSIQQQQQQQYTSSFTINNIHRNGQPPPPSSSVSMVFGVNKNGSSGDGVLGQQQQQQQHHRYFNQHRTCRDVRYPINLRNEREMMNLLQCMIQQLLSRYLTSLEQDIIDLQNFASYPKYSNKRHAKIQVKGEKMVLHHYLKWSQIALDVMNVIEQEIDMEINNFYSNKNNDTNSHSSFRHGQQQSLSTCATLPSQGIEVRWNDSGSINNNIKNSNPITSSLLSTNQLIVERKSMTHQDNVEDTCSNNSLFANTTIIVDDGNMEYRTPSNGPRSYWRQNATTKPATATTYDMMIRQLEHEMMNDHNDVYIETTHDVHYTILRYCTDVLGHVRKEEIRQVQEQYLQEQQHHSQPSKQLPRSEATSGTTSTSTGITNFAASFKKSSNTDSTGSSNKKDTNGRGSEYV